MQKPGFFILLVLIFPILAVAQPKVNGINFAKNLSWDEIINKAKNENKYVFVDIYATWCGPCKKMDLEVYNKDTVGTFMNANFISIKVQLDTSAKDNSYIRSWYSRAKSICREYNVHIFPTFLFFAPTGKLAFRDAGYIENKGADGFINLAKKSLNPENLTYFSKLQEYERGIKEKGILKRLAQYVKDLGNDTLAEKIAAEYVLSKNESELVNPEDIAFIFTVAKNRNLAKNLAREYLNRLNSESDTSLFNNLRFFDRFTNIINSSDKIFKLAIESPNLIDSLKGIKGWATSTVVIPTIKREELNSRIISDSNSKKGDIHWNGYEVVIHAKYPSVDAHYLMLEYELTYYSKYKNWTAFVKTKNEMLELRPIAKGMAARIEFELNDVAWQVFLFCNEKSVLEEALKWSELAINLIKPIVSPGYLDTKASILYKLGSTTEAIQQEEEAVNILITQRKNGITDRHNNPDDFSDIIAKMKKGEPIYVEEGAVWTKSEEPGP